MRGVLTVSEEINPFHLLMGADYSRGEKDRISRILETLCSPDKSLVFR